MQPKLIWRPSKSLSIQETRFDAAAQGLQVKILSLVTLLLMELLKFTLV